MTQPDFLSRRTFVFAAALAPLAAATARAKALAAGLPSAVDVRRFGAAGDGVHNDTGAFAAALAASPTIFVPAGLYLVDRITVPSGRTILTAGFPTVFRQRRGLPPATRLINVVGSDVRIADCSVEGNIASDTGEQYHGIFVQASPQTGNLSNIVLGNVRGSGLRGDVVYIGSSYGHTVSHVRVGRVDGANILRNVVSICGGRDVSIERIGGSRVGMTHLDIEPDEYNGPVVRCAIGAVHGEFVQIAGQSPKAFVDQVRIGLIELRSPGSRSVPRYAPGAARADALTIRNVRSLDIGRLVARGFGGPALRQIWNPGALTDQYVHIAKAELSDCSRDRRSVPAYIQGDRRATRLRIDDLAIDITRPGVDAIRDCKTVRIGHSSGKLPKGSRLIAQSALASDTTLYLVGGAAAVVGGLRLAGVLRA